ncbi:MAG: hypothetical protein R3B13_29990 [Polyangiaceae bacterium]
MTHPTPCTRSLSRIAPLLAALTLSACGGTDSAAPTEKAIYAAAVTSFAQSDGYNHFLSLEAESFQASQSGSTGDSWRIASSKAGFSGSGYVEAGPDNGTNQGYTLQNGTTLTFNASFVASGNHYAWLRSAACGTGNDSVHLGIDGVAAVKRWTTDSSCAWTWSMQQVSIPSIGEHSIEILMAEDGFRLDKIVLTTNSKWAPAGLGPDESAVPDVPVKFHPGHYVAMVKSNDTADVVDSLRPGVQGVQIRYTWRELEPSQGNYDFSRLQADVDLVSSHGATLIALVEDKSFNAEVPTPAYLSGLTKPTSKGGWTALRWHPTVVQRFGALLAKIGERFDEHAGLEGVAIQETALGFTNATLDANGYTPEKYRDALIDVLSTAKAAAPHSQVFWYMNFLSRHQGYLADVASAVAPLGVTMGGPDILPESASLNKHVYPLYSQFAGKMNLFCSAQFDSYEHVKSATGKFYTPTEIFQFARDDLHVRYVLWNRKTWTTPANSYNWYDAVPVMAQNPTFN